MSSLLVKIIKQLSTLFRKSQYVGEYGSYDFLGILILGESGNVIQEISNNVTEEPILVKISDKYKLLFNDCEYIEDDGRIWDLTNVYVYSCPGNGSNDSTSVQNVPAKVKRNAFPNPATDLVTLPYDANGATSMKIWFM